jgi:glyoxylase-like metal-dependent hydrolase (beta-lactamase superfamily II)
MKTLVAAASAGVVAPRTFAVHQKFKRFGAIESRHFDVVRISESVLAVRGKPDTGIPTNSSIIVGENGVVVVDAHLRPSLDREVIGIVKQITDRPIRYLINTHWHQDHTLGNQAFEAATIIGHETTKTQLTERVGPNLQLQREVLPDHLVQAREALAQMKAEGGDPEQIEKLRLQIELDEEYLQELSSIRVSLPTRVFKESYKLDISTQPVELLHPGLGHTRGDIIVYLPEERMMVFGDLVTAGQPFMRKNDAVPSQWAPTLRKIAELKWDKGVIGHGWVEDPRARLNIMASFLDALVLEVRRAFDSKVAPPEVVRTVLPSLMEFAPHFPYFEQAVFENITRAWEELQPERDDPAYVV